VNLTTEQWEAVKRLVQNIGDLASESEGVAGLHRNGDLAPWDELFQNGWLESYVIARDVIAEIEAVSTETGGAK
jgi:hypothetical protein